MKRNIVVKPLLPRGRVKKQYDGIIACLGYESRSRYISEAKSPKADIKLALAYLKPKIFSYMENESFFEANGFDVVGLSDAVFHVWCRKRFSELFLPSGGNKSLLIDISSLSRFRLASVISGLRSIPGESTIEVDFLYTVPQFTDPPSMQVPNTNVGPILGEFAGWTDDPNLPTLLLIGLGYEEDKALGAAEYLDPASIFTFMPMRQDQRFRCKIENANKRLWDFTPTEHRLTYQLGRPFDNFVKIESFIYGAVTNSRPVILPLGPKIFALCSILVGCIHPTIGVWRVSTGAHSVPVNRYPTDRILGLKTYFVKP